MPLTAFSICTITALLLSPVNCQTGGSVTSRTLHKDIVIIGGGAAGSYAAVKLRDHGQDVVLIERQEIIGGAVDSYFDEKSNHTFEFGVGGWLDWGNATDFFARLNISTTLGKSLDRRSNTSSTESSSAATSSTSSSSAAGTTHYVDFTSGKVLNYTIPTNTSAVWQTYLTLAEKYQNYTLAGYWNFPNASDIPEELLMKWEDVAPSLGIESVTAQFQGVGVPKYELVMTNMVTWHAPAAASELGLVQGFTVASGRNQDLYDAVATLLGEDVLTLTTVTSCQRDDDSVTIHASQIAANGTTQNYTIHANKLLVAINPTLQRMQVYDLDDEERAVFSKFNYTRIYAGIIRTTAKSGWNSSIVNLPVSAEPANYLETPGLPYVKRLDSLVVDTDTEMYQVSVTGGEDMISEQAQEVVRSGIQTLVGSGVFSNGTSTSSTSDLDFLAWESHGTMHLRASADDYRAGFVQDWYGLQGKRSTWYSGAAWSSQIQSIVYAYDDILLSKMLAS